MRNNFDAIIVYSRPRNISIYECLMDSYAREVARSHLHKVDIERPDETGRRPRLMLDDAVRNLVNSQAARVLSIVEAPVEVYHEAPPTDALRMLTEEVRGPHTQLLVIDERWSHIKVKRMEACKAGDPTYFGWPANYTYDPDGPAKLAAEVASEFPHVEILMVSEADIGPKVEQALLKYTGKELQRAYNYC